MPSTQPSQQPPRREPGTIRVGQVGGVDVLVRASWLLVAAVIAVLVAPAVDQVRPGLGPWRYLAGAAFAVLLYLSVLLHELSHALMAQRYGLPVRSITLHFLGGVTEIEGEPQTPGREFAVSVVGPITSIAVGAGAWLLYSVTPDGLPRVALALLAGANLVVGALNLVPGLPLDGGRVLRAVVWKVTGDPHRGTVVAGWAGRVTALVVLAYPVGWSAVTGRPPDLFDVVFAGIIAAFLWSGASQAITSARIRRRLPALHARALARRVVPVPADLPLSEAVRRAQEQRAGGIVTLGPDGAPAGVVNEAAVLATPEARRPWLPVSAVARTLEPGLTLPAGISGEPLVRAMQRTPASEYLLVEQDGSIFGMLVTEDVDRAFAGTR